MLKEFKKVRQTDNTLRKLYGDEYFDLYLWFNIKTTDFTGFQLVFCVNRIEMALTAEIGEIPNIHRVDSGDGEFYDPTDLLDGRGFFPKTELMEEFEKRSSIIDPTIRRNILKVINTYNDNGIEMEMKLTPIY